MANYIVQKESLEIVADSIRAKAGISEKLEFPFGWKVAVDGITGGGGGVGVGLTASATAFGVVYPMGFANSGFTTENLLFTAEAANPDYSGFEDGVFNTADILFTTSATGAA